MSNAVTSQGNEFQWRFVAPVHINSCTSNPVSCGRFDPYEELFWTGSSTGKVSSWMPQANNFPRYTAFVVSKSSGIHHLEPTENAIFSLTDTVLRATSRQGIPLTSYTTSSMQKMEALCRLPGTSTFVMGGFQKKLILYDFAKEKEIRTAELHNDETAVIIRYNGTNTFSADEKGKIHVKNPKNYETVSVMGCYNDRVLDFDVQGTTLITCGVSIKNNSNNADRFLKVYDLRMNKHLSTIDVHNCAQFVRFMPSYCARVAVVYQNFYHPNSIPNYYNMPHPAGISMFDMDNSRNPVEFAIDTSLITSFDFSSNKNYIAVGNNLGCVNVFTDKSHPMVNDHSKETIFSVPPAQPPLSFVIDDMSHSVGSIPMPFPREPLVSDWPSELTQIVYRRRREPAEMKNVKAIHYATQITNPRIGTNLKFYNVVPYILELEDLPEEPFIKIPPEQICFESPLPSSEKVKVPKLYKKRPPSVTPARHGKSSNDTLEGYTWNVIRHITLQSTHAMNMVANAVVQVVYYLGALRNIVLQHICTEDSCITCELHFLFSTFPSKVRPDEEIGTTNLAWALARNGVSLKTGGVMSAIQQVIKTLFDDVDKKVSDTSSAVQNKFDRHLRCIRCGELQSVEEGSEHLLTLNYLNHSSSFCRALEKSLHLGADSGERECAACKQISRMECKRKIVELSPVLLINTNTSAEGYLDFWQRQLSEHESRPRLTESSAFVPESPLEKKNCRYGDNCRDKKSCKFVHGHIDWAAEQTKLLEDIDGIGWNHYIPSRIATQVCDGIVRITDISDTPTYEEPNAVIYELDAMVHLIGNGQQEVNWTHPVTLLRESPVASIAWTMINEQLVSRLHDHEARHVDARWKLPALIAYRQKGVEVTITERNVADDLFFVEKNLAIRNAESPSIKTMEELPKKGELVGLDTEFIRVKTNLLEFNGRTAHTKVLARASCLDVTGEKIIFDDHIKMNKDLVVTDYLTKYSGIVESDLNPETSDKYLSTHKLLLLRMHVLIQRGVIFVGHALINDFSVMNVHVDDSQIMDTVHLWQLDAQRMLSLKFLVKEVLGETIQEFSHDSVVDARYSLKLYHKSIEMKASGIFGPEMRRMYSIMPVTGCTPNPGASPLTVSTLRLATNESAAAAPKSV